MSIKAAIKAFVDAFLAEDLDEMTTTGAIGTVEMPLGNVKKADQTPKNPPDSSSSEPDRVGKITR